MAELAKQRYERAVKLTRLSAHPDNPRHGDTDAIGESIEANGFYGAVVAQEGTGVILAGKHRWDTAADRGLSAVPVIWIDVDDETARRIVAADNRTSDLGWYDDAALAELLKSIASTEAGLTGTGFDDTALNMLLASVALHEDDSSVIAGPESFPTIDPTSINVEHTCPRCGYEW